MPKDLHSRWTICPLAGAWWLHVVWFLTSTVALMYQVILQLACSVDPHHQFFHASGTLQLSRLLCLVDSTSTLDLSRVADGPTWRAKARARLLSLDLHDFKSIRRRNFQLEGRSLSCLVGSNSSGKSAILDALRFGLCRHCDRNLRDYIRRGKPITSAARVTAQFRYEQEADEGSIQGERSLKLHMFGKKH